MAELVSVAEHLVACQTCHQLFVETLQARRPLTPLRIDLSLYAVVKHEHFEYEQLVEYADNSLDEIEREMADLHLEHCATCREDLRSFLDFRRELAEDIENSQLPPA